MICLVTGPCLAQQMRQDDPRELIADGLAGRGELFKALIHWKILLTLHPQNHRYKTRIAQLQGRIRQRVTEQFNLARARLAAGNEIDTRRSLLDILAMDPKNQRALQMLRHLEQQKMASIQHQNLVRLQKQYNIKQSGVKTVKNLHYLKAGIELFNNHAYQEAVVTLENFIYDNPHHKKARQYLYRAHMHTARHLAAHDELQQTLYHLQRAEKYLDTADRMPGLIKQITRTKRQLADQYYHQGLRVYLKDADKAIDLWKTSLELDPDNFNTRARLNSAMQRQQNIQQIRAPR